MSDTAKHPSRPVSCRLPRNPPGGQLKVRKENVSRGASRGMEAVGGGVDATGNAVEQEPTEEAWKAANARGCRQQVVLCGCS